MSRIQRSDSGPEHGMIPIVGAARREQPRMFSLLIAFIFGAAGLLWIWGSDEVLQLLSLPRDVAHAVEVWKGTGYVLVTSIVLYLLVSRPLVRLVRAQGREARARAEAQARTEELETVLNAVPVAVWIARDPECRVIEGNRVGREMLGQSEPVNLSLSAPTAERLAGFKVLVGGQELAAEDLPVQLAARTGEDVRDCEEELVFEDGRRVSLYGNAVPLRDAEGRVTGAVGAFMDVTQREHAVQQLSRNQLILEQAQEVGQIGSWVSDPAHHGGTLEWSRETYRIFGVEEGGFDGSVDTFFSFVHEDDREAVRQASLDAIAGKQEYAIEHRIVRPDGAVRWVHERARVERDSAGEPLRMIGICQDITERVEGETALRESEARLREAMDAAGMLGWELELAKGAVTYSQDPIAYFGVDAGMAERLGTDGALIVHPQDREQVLAKYAEALSEGHEFFEMTFRSDTVADEKWFRSRARVVRDGGGRPIKTIGVTMEITSQRLAEERVRRSEAKYRTIVETCQEGVWLVGADWKTTFVNHRMAEMLGREPAEMLGRTVLEFMSEDDRERTLAHMREREAGIAAQHEYRFVRPDGREIWAFAATNAIMEEGGEFVGALAMFTDISDRRRMDQSLRQSEAQLRVLFKSLPVPAWVFDSRTLRFLAVNDAAMAKYGYTEREFLSKTILDIRPESERPRTLAMVTDVRRGFHESGGWKHVLADGRLIDVEVTSHDLDFEGVRARVVLARDVTESLRTAAALAQSEERYRHLFNALPDPAWDWDIVNDRSTFSATWPGLLGHEPNSSEADGASWESLLHPEDRERVLAKLRRCTDERKDAYEAEYRIRCRDGSYKWVLSRGRVVERDDAGRAKRMIGAITDMSARRQAEADLRLSEARYRKLTESAPEAIVVLDVAERRFTDFNPQAERFFGLSAEELSKVGPAEVSPERQPDGRLSTEAAAASVEQAVGGMVPSFEWVHRAADGREIPCEIRLVLLPDRDRVLIRGSITDITDRKLAQQALAESEERLRIFIQSAPAGVAMLDRELRYIAYSRRWLSDYGLGEQDLTGRRHYDVFPEIDDRWKAIHRRCLTGVAERCEEDRLVREDGSVDYLRWEIQPWRDSTGAVGGLVFFTEMITERKLAEIALRASEEKYRLVLRATSDAMWDYEPSTGRLQWGDNVETMFGVTLSEMGNRLEGWSDRLHPDDHDRTLKSFNDAVGRGDERWTAEYRFRKNDGTYAVVLDRAYVLRAADGRVVRIIGAMTDISERRHSEQLMSGQARTLELLVGGEPLERVLQEIVQILEDLEPGCLGSVLLLNDDGLTARSAAAPHLPRAYSDSLDGIKIGPGVGSCGTAMHERRRVIVSDIATDPLWAAYKDLALPHGLRACWSEPVIGAGGRVLGSLAMYYHEPRGPGERELRSIAWAARLAGLAIERRQAEGKLRKRETDLRDLLDAVPDLMFRMDREGRYLEYHAPNPADLLLPPDRFLGRFARDVLPPERAAQCMQNLERAIATGEPQVYEYQGANEPGRKHWEVRVTRCAEDQALLLIRDVTSARVAERKLRDNEQRLSLLVRQSPLGVIVWDLNFCVAEWNKAAEQIFGWPAPEALGRHAEFILPESARAHVREIWQALRENRGGTRSTNANVTREGRTIYCEWYNAPLADAQGRIFAVASIVDDVTEQRVAQQRQQLMMAELDHRVKNNLAAVISLAEQSGRATTTFAEFRESFLGRVRALSRLHNALAATRWQGANLGTMVRQTLEAFGQDATSQAVVAGPTVVLPARAAQAMGMALNELCTNAIKYGALSAPGGRIEARWAIRPAETTVDPDRSPHAGPPRPNLELLWAEKGGPTVSEPTRRGFGTELIEGAISYELGGSATMQFMPEGLRCRIRIEMPEDAEFDTREVQPGSLDE